MTFLTKSTNIFWMYQCQLNQTFPIEPFDNDDNSRFVPQTSIAKPEAEVEKSKKLPQSRSRIYQKKNRDVQIWKIVLKSCSWHWSCIPSGFYKTRVQVWVACDIPYHLLTIIYKI